MIDQTQRSIYLKLIELTIALQNPVSKINSCINDLDKDIYPDNVCQATAEFKRYLKTSLITCEKLIRWSEPFLLGDIVCSGNIRFQAELIIKILNSTNTSSLLIFNTLADLKHAKINLTLFGFVLQQLLTIISRFSPSERLSLSSLFRHQEIIVCIDGIQSSTYQKMGESILKNPKSINELPEVDNFPLCYEILNLYGGNLWSKKGDKSGSKLYFSIPMMKNN